MECKGFERNYKLPTQLQFIKGWFFVRYTSLAVYASKEQSRLKCTTGYIQPGNAITISQNALYNNRNVALGEGSPSQARMEKGTNARVNNITFPLWSAPFSNPISKTLHM